MTPALFVAVGQDGLRIVSADGAAWRGTSQSARKARPTARWPTAEVFSQPSGHRSQDGRTWERTPNRDAPTTVAYGAGVFVGASWKGRLLRFTDGIEWKQVHKCDQNIEALAFGAV